MITLIAYILMVLIVATIWWFGLWSNLITLVNFLIASLIASSYYANLSNTLKANLTDYPWACDFLAVWILFIVSYLVCRSITDLLSKHRLEFDFWTEMVGRTILSVWVAWLFIGFTSFTLHMAPLYPEDYLPAETDTALGLGADHMWLSLIQSRSRGALASSINGNNFVGPYTEQVHVDDAKLQARVFDPFGAFIRRHRAARYELVSLESFSGPSEEKE